MSNRNRYTSEQRADIAQYINRKVLGLPEQVQRHSLPDSSAFIAANPSKFERLPDYGNMFPTDRILEIG